MYDKVLLNVKMKASGFKVECTFNSLQLYNLVNFHPILTNEVSKSKLDFFYSTVDHLLT